MKRKRRNKKREKMIMLCSSALVLSVLTVTGVYVKESNQKQEDYVIDLSQLEEKKIAKDNNQEAERAEEEVALVDSKKVENNKVLEKKEQEVDDKVSIRERATEFVIVENEEEKAEELVPEFTEEDVLLWPIVGNILIDYSMDKPVYFSSLEQYKYHPAIVIKAEVGKNVTAAADGRISKIEKQDQLGNVITMELGNGYEIDYGQLTNIQVKVGDYVNQGDYLADVAEPTKFYSVEGSNIHFALRKDGKPMNPMERIQ